MSEEFCVNGSNVEHSKHANLILQRASTCNLQAIERQRRLALRNLMRQKRLVLNEICSHRDPPVTTFSFCRRSGGETDSNLPVSRRETRSATLRRETISLGKASSPTALTGHRGFHYQPVKLSSEKVSHTPRRPKTIPGLNSSDEGEEEASSHKEVDLLFEGLTVSRRTQETLRQNETSRDERMVGTRPETTGAARDGDQLQSAVKPRSSKIVSFKETQNQTYIYNHDFPSKTRTYSPIITDKPPKCQVENTSRRRLVQSANSAYRGTTSNPYTTPMNRSGVMFNPPSRESTRFPPRQTGLPPASHWAIRSNGRLYRRSTNSLMTRPRTTPESQEMSKTTRVPPSTKTSFDPLAAYRFPTVDREPIWGPHQSPTGVHSSSSLDRRITRPGREQTVLHLRRVEQSRENEYVLNKVGRFLGKNWAGQDADDKDQDEDSSGSDVIDDEEDLMMQRTQQRRFYRC